MTGHLGPNTFVAECEVTGVVPPRLAELDLSQTTTLLCDADGNLFPSEEPAFEASTAVVNAFLAHHGVGKRFTPTELRLATTGKNFRSTIRALAYQFRIPLAPDIAVARGATLRAARYTGTLLEEDVERWVAREKLVVTAALRRALRPDPEIRESLTTLSRRFVLAAVSSSASSRLDACFEATGLSMLFPESRRFSAEDSLPKPLSKPDPAVYSLAGSTLGVTGRQGLAIEDSAIGATAAMAAGYPTIGNVQFVPAAERPERIHALRQVGVVAIISSWSELAEVLSSDITGHPGVRAS